MILFWLNFYQISCCLSVLSWLFARRVSSILFCRQLKSSVTTILVFWQIQWQSSVYILSWFKLNLSCQEICHGLYKWTWNCVFFCTTSFVCGNTFKVFLYWQSSITQIYKRSLCKLLIRSSSPRLDAMMTSCGRS